MWSKISLDSLRKVKAKAIFHLSNWNSTVCFAAGLTVSSTTASVSANSPYLLILRPARQTCFWFFVSKMAYHLIDCKVNSEVIDLNNGANSTGAEIQFSDTLFQELDSPSQEFLPLVFIGECFLKLRRMTSLLSSPRSGTPIWILWEHFARVFRHRICICFYGSLAASSDWTEEETETTVSSMASTVLAPSSSGEAATELCFFFGDWSFVSSSLTDSSFGSCCCFGITDQKTHACRGLLGTSALSVRRLLLSVDKPPYPHPFFVASDADGGSFSATAATTGDFSACGTSRTSTPAPRLAELSSNFVSHVNGYYTKRRRINWKWKRIVSE
ncbi:hypothetical protein F3Y22_tig00110676pilonHSYRG00310 [Hibiscus syriacus]|uniref:Uncharacterized protein n=1 Tax=Hibiscus syriacus TaxID=106335 RepID=A0A6A2ZWA0_HIBSY|nr:hypothetical protein F3Y22_tig00110676pilonHSYRG00310 [Hibiscus syriacus]